MDDGSGMVIQKVFLISDNRRLQDYVDLEYSYHRANPSLKFSYAFEGVRSVQVDRRKRVEYTFMKTCNVPIHCAEVACFHTDELMDFLHHQKMTSPMLHTVRKHSMLVRISLAWLRFLLALLAVTALFCIVVLPERHLNHIEYAIWSRDVNKIREIFPDHLIKQFQARLVRWKDEEHERSDNEEPVTIASDSVRVGVCLNGEVRTFDKDIARAWYVSPCGPWDPNPDHNPN